MLRAEQLKVRIWRVALYSGLCLFSIITLVPFVWLVSSSLKNAHDFFLSAFLPRGEGFLGIAWHRLTLDNFRSIFGMEYFTRQVMNSVFLASATSLLATLFSAMSGYALARFRFRGRRFATLLVLATLIIPAPLLLAPTYQLLYWLGLLNTHAGLILPAVAPAFGIFLFRQATLNSIPEELVEAARMDGCGELRIFFSVVLPLVRPTIGAFLMIMFLASWNNFINPQVILQSPEKYPLSVAIANLRDVFSQNHGALAAATLFSVAPVVALFLLLQREYLAGLTSGAVKS